MKTTLVMDIGGSSIKHAVFDGAGNLSGKQETVYNVGKDRMPVREAIRAVLREHPEYDRIGISATGQIDAVNGKVVGATKSIPDYEGLEIKQLVQRETGRPAVVLNDANAAALGEAYYGVKRQDFICLTYGTGIGGAIVQNGRLYTGAIGIAGEFGHMLTHAGGERCSCGALGCYEAYASATALVKQASRLNPAYDNGRTVFSKAQQDPELKKVLDNWMQEVAAGLIGLAYIFNPHTFVLGGGVMQESWIAGRIEEILKLNLMHSFADIEVLSARLGNQAGLYGAYVAAEQSL